LSHSRHSPKSTIKRSEWGTVLWCFCFSGPLKIGRFVIYYFEMTMPAVAKPLSIDRGEEKAFWANLGGDRECDIFPRNPELCQAEFRKNTKKTFRAGSQRG